jgi:hypothetical protein
MYMQKHALRGQQECDLRAAMMLRKEQFACIR